VGQWIAIIIGFWLANSFQINPYLTELCSACWVIKYLICFALFRFFDIVKPFPVGWIDRNVKGGLGVMLDDVVAGILAGMTSVLIFYVIALI
jgi:phosphatidylglycerophosphatase A